MSTVRKLARLEADRPVFFISVALIVAFVLFGAVAPDTAETVFGEVQTVITDRFGWLYTAVVWFFLGFVLWVSFSRFGKLRLGADDARPRYRLPTWFAMLFTAGMGIGVLFWSVAEPINHFLNAPTVQSQDADGAREAINLTLLHWGVHAWAVYIIVGLTLAYMAYRRGMPISLRSVFYPVFGERVHGPLGRAIDIFAVLGTMFGVATTLGLGAQQMMAGVNHMSDLPATTTNEILLIAIVTAIATLSVVAGLDKGIRRLAIAAAVLAVVLFTYVLLVGPTARLLGLFMENLGYYVQQMPTSATWSAAYEGDEWYANWTLFYWGWWLAWAPFVGVFIARISYGRTIRQFALGALFAPTLVTFFWYSVFGNYGMQRVLAGDNALVQAVEENFPVAIFVFFEGLPLTLLLSLVGVAIILLFFVTSSDSASLVIDMLTSGGNPDPPRSQRVFWAVSEGAVAAVLLLTGGLSAMRTFQITTGLPLAIILLAMCYFLVRALRTDDASYEEGIIVPSDTESGAVEQQPAEDPSELWVAGEQRRHG